MKLWYANRADYDYDEPDAWVIAALTSDRAAELTGYQGEKGFKITYLGEAKEGQPCEVVLESFNAG